MNFHFAYVKDVNEEWLHISHNRNDAREESGLVLIRLVYTTCNHSPIKPQSD